VSGDYLTRKAARVRERRSVEAPRGAALVALRDRARERPRPPDLTAALTGGDRVALVAEFKRRSPSAGTLADGIPPAAAARAYEASGAAALSVLTDEPDFDGSLADLAEAAGAVPLPVLRKDFLVDEAGVYEARLHGAAAALLIMRILEGAEPRRLVTAAEEVGLTPLVEVHDESELERALAAGAGVVGINNRDLMALTTDLAVTERLAPQVPAGVAVVSESGIRTAADVERVRDAGAHGVLVGEALMRLDDDERRSLCAALAGVPR
jgi:indole-3-glycerol phosphate synthase